MSIELPRHQSAPMVEPVLDLRACVRVGLKLAAFLSVCVLVLLVLASAGVLLGLLPEAEPPLRDVWIPLPVILAAYFVGGATGGAAWWAMRPLRRSVAGWIHTGVVITAAAFGTVGVLGAIAYSLVGLNIGDVRSVGAAWAGALMMLVGPAVVVGPFVGLWMWFAQRD